MKLQEKRILFSMIATLVFVVGCQKDDGSGDDSALQCFTPCRSGTVIDGEYVSCPSDGLMPACIGGTECIGGSCVAPGSDVPVCDTDMECPGFQTCVDDRCISNCDYDSDCGSSEGCYKHVCRMACTAWSDTCEEGRYCNTLDGDYGFCLPLAPSEGQSQDIIGSFEVSAKTLRLSVVENSQEVVITNNTPMALEFTVRKVEHKEFTSDGIVKDRETPLYWMHMGQTGEISQVEEFSIIVDGGGSEGTFTVGEATNEEMPVWSGVIEVTNDRVGSQRIDLTYASRPDGQWTGRIYYFGNFGTQNLEEWTADKADSELLEQVHNAFVQKWGAFRQGSITFDNFQAVLTATRSASWDWASMRPPHCPKEACYPYDNALGYGEYSDDLDSNPVPSGLVELPVALNLTEASSPTVMTGKISTSDTLHYAGEPAIDVSFASDPTSCAPGVTSACLAFLQDFSADVVVGGRYIPEVGATSCDLPGFELVTIPWLVPGFDAGTVQDVDTGLRYRNVCRDKTQPNGAADMEAANLTFSGSNPVPDGRSRQRHLELVDGALINQRQMVIIFRESFPDSFSFVSEADEDDFSAYGIMVLERNPTTLSEDAFEGSSQSETRTMPEDKLTVQCTDAVIQKVFGGTVPDWESDPDSVNTLANALISGVNSTGDVELVDGFSEVVHYLCHDTGLFDQGPPDESNTCPLGSNVTFFTVNGMAIDQDEIDNLSCQVDGSCQDTLDAWLVDPAYSTYSVRLNPYWSCATAGETYCEDDRYDMRATKQFYAEISTATVFVPLLTEVNNAFRYKTAFMNRSGRNVGFAPEVCVPNSNIIPYCYDPVSIEEVKERVDCVLYLNMEHNADLVPATRTIIKEYLVTNYSVDPIEPGRSLDGFEALMAELLVMQGDESYTQAFASRFDLAGVMRATFEGSLFEPDGINLSGVAGHEMYTLYESVQYYQMALDRFYSMMPYVWASLGSDAAANFITQETVTNYFDRLIRASTQKSRAWSEVAKRYQSFNRPDLARLVVERAYTATYLESVLITRMMQKVVRVVEPEDKNQILFITDQAQKQYKMALLDMRDVYKGITDDVNYFGFAPDYIPFPALDDEDDSAFDMLIASAWSKTGFAAEKEVLALEKNRDYETDGASFQAELVTIRNNYENQLADLCGTFEGPDGLYYPATGKYAYLDEKAKFLGDPCGYMGNGAIHEAMAQMEIAALDLRKQVLRRDNKLEEIDIEMDRVTEYCGLVVSHADYIVEFMDEQSSLQEEIDDAEATVAACQRAMDYAFQLAEFIKCTVGTATDCPMTAGAIAAATAAYVGNEALIIIQDLVTAEASAQKAKNELEKARFEIEIGCNVAEIDSDAVVKNLYIETTEINLDILKAYYELKLSFDGIEALRNEAKRLEVEQQDTEQLAINVEAARNDPNVRIYKNDAIINADRAFDAAIREAYKATRVYEYYTSQTYEKVDQLFLIRMVAAGDYNLENYLMELEDAFYVFEETYGNPDLRVQIVSLRDDILNVPWLEANAEALTESERLAIFQQMLQDPDLLDSNGYLTVSFSTDVDGLSPLTRNHKIYYMEAEIVGSDIGDTLGRIYLKQRGTGTVHSVLDDSIYYVFPDRTAVINTFFNGDRGDVFSTENLFTNMRLRDRPFANTLWELVFNQRDEEVNKDINLASVSDIRLYVYYTDFTEL